ncbi:TPA: NAD-dependent epimerase/dehydratase family protein [Vibrio parahaemolyticus]|uniref:NAD-dependent epimerase/dehydratase family protein n=1 Tax=Vibrio parahaemolyticus TaxID=670 RepID=UPI00111CFC4F|nr:NAD-dependent epimerase/dehydratase family protein [Vibrio parahaemolyticus]ELB1136528.1 NAD-dependent epimerase/dehydratase family protein [Vibrio parahaemolyticus]MBD2855479.1 NAD-dependent epimerase/dehydratase family protein [Vibrio parahaemolyticus]MBE4207283.1 NAD-dependent epimerase/dehydratase family protein [Vibrio parahaemolyticus]MBW6448174.1 NAD-dependent epimerase/dehydratase family protein [Vibrio parahaemolyticus]TPA37748.1 NAD-dependent epimerase/dehydratase family protein [
MTILVTGATGFVGQNLTQLNQNFRCVIRAGEHHSFADSYTVSTIDASTDWSNCFEGVDAIIHLAGLAHNKSYTDAEYRAVNADGTLRLALKAAEAGVKRFVFVSSIGVNGTNSYDSAFLPSDVADPHNSYAQSKHEAELGLWDISKQTGLEVVVVRPTLVYGPNAPGNFGMLTKLVNSIPFLPFGLANNRRDFISVGNLVDLLIVCAKHKNAPGNIFLASESNTISTRDFVNAIAAGQDRKVFQIPIPVSFMRLAGLVIGKSAMIEQLFGNLEVDSSNLKDILNWTPPYSMKDSMAMLRK